MKRLTFKDKINAKTVVALGLFDAVHLGHQEVIGSAVSFAKNQKISAAVFTFTDKSNSLKKKESGSLYSIEHRCRLFENVGADYVIMPDFSEVKELSPYEFVRLLKTHFNASAFFCGEDFRFGKNAEGDVKMLKELSRELEIQSFVIKEVKSKGETVSTTSIKRLIKEGKIKEANELLGRAYSIRSTVVSGKQIGKKQLYPTINQELCISSVLKYGVYASKTVIDGKEYASVTNIGICPTFENISQMPTAETYILNEDIELYGKEVEVCLMDFLREEKKFESVELLKEQIKKDIEKTQRLF